MFKSFIGHLKNLYSGTQGIPHQTIENLDLSQSYKSFLASNCKGNEEVKHFASVLWKYCERCWARQFFLQPIVQKELSVYSDGFEWKIWNVAISFLSNEKKKSDHPKGSY